MKVLVIGGGGREHALCWAIARSPLVTTLYCAPGNPGIEDCATLVPIAADAIDALVEFAVAHQIDFVVPGPEAPLTLGVVDRMTAAGIACFGPSQAAAALEGSKGFMKDVIARAGVPTAAYGRFTDVNAALAFVREQGAPIVVKADGLAAGKGVTVAMTLAEAEQAVVDALEGGRFGAAGAELVIEEFLDGEEVSFFVLTDGEAALAMVGAQDHKRVGDGDTGPNTGGMGAYSPAPIFTPEIEAEVMEKIIRPSIDQMRKEGAPFRGVLFAGLMLTSKGVKLLEYNVRFGDPECQVLMARLQSDLLPALIASAKGGLDQVSLSWSPDPAVVVVVAAKGYPDAPTKGGVIEGLDQVATLEGVKAIHAGTKRRADGALVADGGRVLGIVGTAPSLRQAVDRAYAGVDALRWTDGFCRRDIAWRALSGS